MKTQREKFEDWIDSLTFDQLHSLEEQSAWTAWQAAIESVVVYLSEIDGVTDDSGRTRADVVYMGDVEDALDKAGIKYE